MNTKKNILICPLEWGLGHAARMIPVALRLRELDQNIIFGAGEEHLAFLRKEVPGARYISFPGFKMKYSKYLPQYLMILLSLPRFVYHSLSENFRLRNIIRDYSIDIVISDNRPGLWNRSVKCVYVTHQLRIRFPYPFRFLEFTGISITRWITGKYSLCLVPDLPGEINLSGELSHGMKLAENIRYAGILSRFSGRKYSAEIQKEKILVILSGPEPQRSLLKKKIHVIAKGHGLGITFFEGRPLEADQEKIDGQAEFISHPGPETSLKYILGSRKIISRAGYTTIMELTSLGRTALLVPTDGQTEQEYLAGYLSEKGWFASVKMRDLNEISLSGPVTERVPDFFIKNSGELLEKVLSEILEDQ